MKKALCGTSLVQQSASIWILYPKGSEEVLQRVGL